MRVHRQKFGQNKREEYLGVLTIMVIFLGVLLVCVMLHGKKQVETYQYSTDYVLTEEIPYRMSFCYFSEEEWQNKIKENEFGEVVTIEMLRWLAEETGTSEYVVLPEGKEHEAVSRQAVNEVYEQFLDLLDENGIVIKSDVVVLNMQEKEFVTAEMHLKNDMELSFVETMKSYQFYIKEQQIIGVAALQGENTSVKNVYLLSESEDNISFLYDGETYEMAMTDWEIQNVKDHVCDLVWENGALSRIQLKEDTIKGNLIAVNEQKIQIEGYGEISRSDKLPVYKIYGTVEEKELSDIVIANMQVEYVVAEDRVEAILLLEPASISRIRVLLLGEDGGVLRQQACVTSDAKFKVATSAGEEEKEPQTVIDAAQILADDTENAVRIMPSEENALLYICNENGEKVSLGYRGILELHKYEEGYTIISELSVEDYLCAVVPSEMPSAYGIEALKAQAVCARSYAYIQLAKGGYASYGAHIDDSTNYQVYNKQERSESTDRAVWDTAGEVLKFGETIAEAYYFSTSSGVTATGDAWGLDGQENYNYLKSIQVNENPQEFDFSNEDVYREYIQSVPQGYDSITPFFRWNAICRYESKDCQKKIKNILSTRKEKSPDTIHFYKKNGKEIEEMKGFGDLKKISVTNRSKSGVILELLIEYKKGSVRIENEYTIRAVLGAGCENLTLQDGSVKEDVVLLPSAFAAVIPVEDGSYHIKGGGYGHGIGMSQNGANGMAESGKTYKEILQFFFQNIEVLPVS